VANLIRENKTYRITSVIQTGAKKGMQLLDDNMFKLWKDGVVEKSDVLLRAVNPEELGAKIARVERGIFESEEDDTGRPDAA
jgi:twitching motility protein PilT